MKEGAIENGNSLGQEKHQLFALRNEVFQVLSEQLEGMGLLEEGLTVQDVLFPTVLISNDERTKAADQKVNLSQLSIVVIPRVGQKIDRPIVEASVKRAWNSTAIHRSVDFTDDELCLSLEKLLPGYRLPVRLPVPKKFGNSSSLFIDGDEGNRRLFQEPRREISLGVREVGWEIGKKESVEDVLLLIVDSEERNLINVDSLTLPKGWREVIKNYCLMDEKEFAGDPRQGDIFVRAKALAETILNHPLPALDIIEERVRSFPDNTNDAINKKGVRRASFGEGKTKTEVEITLSEDKIRLTFAHLDAKRLLEEIRRGGFNVLELAKYFPLYSPSGTVYPDNLVIDLILQSSGIFKSDLKINVGITRHNVAAHRDENSSPYLQIPMNDLREILKKNLGSAFAFASIFTQLKAPPENQPAGTPGYWRKTPSDKRPPSTLLVQQLLDASPRKTSSDNALLPLTAKEKKERAAREALSAEAKRKAYQVEKAQKRQKKKKPKK